jgi:hypothetical protein
MTDDGRYRISVDDMVDGTGVKYLQLCGIAPGQVNRLSQIAMLSSLLLSLLEDHPATEVQAKKYEDEIDGQRAELYELRIEREALVRLLERYGALPDDMILDKVAWLINKSYIASSDFRREGGDPIMPMSQPVPEYHLFDDMDMDISKIIKKEVDRIEKIFQDNYSDSNLADSGFASLNDRRKMVALNGLLADYGFYDRSVYDRVQLLLKRNLQTRKTDDSEGDESNE